MRAPTHPTRLAICLGLLASASPAAAQVDARSVLTAISEAGASAPFAAPGSGVVSLIVRDGNRYRPLRGMPAMLADTLAKNPSYEATWSPPRRLLVDQARAWVRADEFWESTGGRGAGVVVGIVDTGIDPLHDDFRELSGRTRIAWIIDYSRPPAGFQPNLEEAYGCQNEGGLTCAIYGADDLQKLIDNSTQNDEPRDVFGHGTHVASLAASNGLSQSSNPRFMGVAPEASLIVARVTRTSANSIQDADILHATEFVFERAAAMSMPAVVNLSLGSDFGPHDGTGDLELGLSQYVGPNHPGHAIVVAAGNSGTLFVVKGSDFPQPLGVHTEAHVPRGSSTRVPLLVPKLSSSTGQGTIFIWVGFADGDRVLVGLDDEDGKWVDPLEPGEAATFKRKEGKSLKATIFNGSEGKNSPVARGTNGAAIVLDGTFESGEVFAVRLEGNGNAQLWMQTEGEIGPGGGGGALFPKATKQGTVNVPASSPDVIAVGATINRNAWPPNDALRSELEVDGMPFFSSAGPNAAGVMKPDLVAPGVFLIGSMSRLADPREGGGGVFDGAGVCPDVQQCLVVDEEHAVTSGTSMAAPVVSGAVALLFERDPGLTQAQVLALLQAGARRPAGTIPVEQQMGPGALDVVASLEAMLADESPLDRRPSSGTSWLSPSASYLRPDPDAGVTVLVQLRDEESRLADGFERSSLTLDVDGAVVDEPLARIAPGMWRFRLAAPAGSGGGRARIQVLFAADVLLSRELPIGVDQFVAEEGLATRGGCAVAPAGASRALEPPVLVLLGAVALGRRRARAARERLLRQ